MTTELARELLASIQCTLALSPEAHGSLDRRLSDGQAVLLAKLEAARKRLALAAATAPDWQSEGREEEFSALENYLRRYDLYCLAHHVPEITVYPYLAPLPENALGLDRAAGRLEMLWAENQIFALFPESRLEPFWDAFCGRDLGLTENPCRGSPVPCRRSGGPGDLRPAADPGAGRICSPPATGDPAPSHSAAFIAAAPKRKILRPERL